MFTNKYTIFALEGIFLKNINNKTNKETKQKRKNKRERKHEKRTGSAGGGGIVVYQYTPKKFAKIPKNHPNIPKIIPRYTLHLKFKESDIPNTHF